MEAAANSDSGSESNSAPAVVNRRATEEERRRVADDGERRYLHLNILEESKNVFAEGSDDARRRRY
ncbi:hypothetical protein DY000_02054197 [Brassica cretica]|uniref:Uncharacterized protein n=1 Tax=Brassica cretica TaxID=69181 RepID=A0ABQ7A8W0_BRACR|nr:hypothetical protein DY000_02054197 [Brassica cretica]